ncbi:MAG: PIN domain-containing protein [Microvirga sp.]
MRVGLDTNVLVYAEGVNDARRKAQARILLSSLEGADVVLPIQAAGELFRVLVRKAKRAPAEARTAVEGWQDLFESEPTALEAFADAMAVAAEHQLDIWDACIVAVAAEAGCRLLLSEDLAEGFTWRGLTVVNPFAASPHPLLARLL